MDVKGAKALSERLAEAARNVDPPPRKRWVQETPTERQRSPALRRLGQPPGQADAKFSATASPCGA